jgi:MFS family permease
MESGKSTTSGWDALAPLREPTFRSIWSASLLSNFGQLILGVGAAWEMTRLAGAPEMVALVQAAMMLPLMLVSVPAGAVADMFDRRKIALIGLGFASLSAATLTALTLAGLNTPWLMLLFCSLIGCGVALYGPSWQASVSEQVIPEHLPAAIALGSISYNLARSFGPAIGGVIVLAAGASAAFAVNALFYVPLFLAFVFWRRERTPARLPPERLDRAIVSGARYAMHAGPVRTIITRALLFGLANAAAAAAPPLIARDLLGGDAGTYGLLLGAAGVGAVAGALGSSWVRERMDAEAALRLCTILAGLSVLGMGLCHDPILMGVLFAISGAASMASINLFNVGVQLAVPRWVAARALSWFVSALSAGLALGSWGWGIAAGDWGVALALVGSGVALLATLLAGFVLPMPRLSLTDVQIVELGHEPEVALAITSRSGPIVLEIDYRVDPEQARQFYNIMLKLRQIRQKNGAFDWSIARDVADPALWTEHCHFPTWGDYLRHRARFTEADREVQASAQALHLGGEGPRVRRRLERPFGSVRWQAETLDPRRGPLDIFTP